VSPWVTDAVAGGLVQAEKLDAYHVIKAAELKAREAAALKRLDGRWDMMVRRRTFTR
jgi:hypothetical protein